MVLLKENQTSLFKNPPKTSHLRDITQRIRARQRDTLHAQNTSPIREMIVKNVQFKWGKEIYAVDVDTSLPGSHLKTQLFSLTSVPPDRIKIMGLKGGKTINDETDLTQCGLEELVKKGKKVTRDGFRARSGESTGK